MTAPNTEYLHFNFVKETATGKGLNSEITMERINDFEYTLTEGRVGVRVGRNKPKVHTLSMDTWNDKYEYYVQHGYLCTKTKKIEGFSKEVIKDYNGKSYRKIADLSVANIVERIMGFASQCFQNEYSVKVEGISDEMLELGTTLLNELATDYPKMSVAAFNSKLIRYYTAIPRRIDNISKKLAKFPTDFADILAKEQELFDVMKSQLKNRDIITEDETVLDSYGLKWQEVTDSEKESIIKLLNGEAKLVNAWRIINERTEKNFNDYCQKRNLTEKSGISHLFHGSRVENFWSIITNGLTINPVGVVITGKAYGNGTYFAPNARKSLGYTSFAGSKWAGGNQSTGFMGIYKVATGKKYDGRNGCDSSLNWKKLQTICPGADCTWAESRWSGFIMDEVIVYQDCQSTIEYLIEVTGR